MARTPTRILGRSLEPIGCGNQIGTFGRERLKLLGLEVGQVWIMGIANSPGPQKHSEVGMTSEENSFLLTL